MLQGILKRGQHLVCVGKVMTQVVFFPDSTLKGAKIILVISDC